MGLVLHAIDEAPDVDSAARGHLRDCILLLQRLKADLPLLEDEAAAKRKRQKELTDELEAVKAAHDKSTSLLAQKRLAGDVITGRECDAHSALVESRDELIAAPGLADTEIAALGVKLSHKRSQIDHAEKSVVRALEEVASAVYADLIADHEQKEAAARRSRAALDGPRWRSRSPLSGRN